VGEWAYESMKNIEVWLFHKRNLANSSSGKVVISFSIQSAQRPREVYD
jgi:hypothetical protein